MQNFPLSLVQAAEEQIISLIIAGRLALGQKITESDLAELFGMSTMPIHEALQKLNQDGLVTIIARKGTFVLNFDSPAVFNLNRVRTVLECEAMREAIAKNYSRLCVSLGRNLKNTLKIQKNKHIEEYFVLDQAFHALFFHYSDNPFLQSSYKAIKTKNIILWNHMMKRAITDLDQVKISIAEHHEIGLSLLNNEVDKAIILLEQHIARVYLGFSANEKSLSL